MKIIFLLFLIVIANINFITSLKKENLKTNKDFQNTNEIIDKSYSFFNIFAKDIKNELENINST